MCARMDMDINVISVPFSLNMLCISMKVRFHLCGSLLLVIPKQDLNKHHACDDFYVVTGDTAEPKKTTPIFYH